MRSSCWPAAPPSASCPTWRRSCRAGSARARPKPASSSPASESAASFSRSSSASSSSGSARRDGPPRRAGRRRRRHRLRAAAAVDLGCRAVRRVRLLLLHAAQHPAGAGGRPRAVGARLGRVAVRLLDVHGPGPRPDRRRADARRRRADARPDRPRPRPRRRRPHGGARSVSVERKIPSSLRGGRTRPKAEPGGGRKVGAPGVSLFRFLATSLIFTFAHQTARTVIQ